MSEWCASREVVAWAAQECEWQQSGEMSVLNMLDGWAWMMQGTSRPLTIDRVMYLGHIVEPRKNDATSWRTCGVRVGWDVKLDPALVPDAMDRLVAASSIPMSPVSWPHLSRDDADEWFRQYEEIHPFRDGNGRTGNILWNWLRGTLDDPAMPPNFWNDPRRAM